MDDRVSRVAAREQNLQVRSSAARFVGQLPAIHPARQSNIGEQKFDLTVAIEQVQRTGRIGRIEHLVTQLSYLLDGKAAHVRLILDEEHGLPIAMRNGGRCGLRLVSGFG